MTNIQVTVVQDDDGTHIVAMSARDVRLIQSGLERGILQAETKSNPAAEEMLRDLLTRFRRGIEARTGTDGTRVSL